MRRSARAGPTAVAEAADAHRRRFEKLVAENYAAILGFARRRTDQPADAADVACDVFLVAWRRIEDVPPGHEARLWLYGVARRTVAGHRRGVARRDALEEKLALAAEIRQVESPDPFFAESFNRALRHLSDDDREVLTLTAWEELSPTEISALIGVPVGTVRVRLFRARRRLEAVLGADNSVKRGAGSRHGEERRAPARRGIEEAI